MLIPGLPDFLILIAFLAAIFLLLSGAKTQSIWWKPSPHRAEWHTSYSWADIAHLLITDPLHPASRETSRARQLGTLLAVLFLVLLALTFGERSFFNHVDLHDPATRVLLRIGVVVLLFAGMFLTLRSKLGAQGRQEWINEVRDELAIFLAEARQLPARARRGAPAVDRVEMERARARLELLLNPSEADHRTLLLLLRIASGMREVKAIDNPVQKPLKDLLTWPNATPVSELRWHTRPAPSEEQSLVTLVYIQRIAAALLKREWQRSRGRA